MGDYLGILGQNSIAMVILAVIFVGVASYFILRRLAFKASKRESQELMKSELSQPTPVISGNGKYKAMVIEMLPEPALDFTYIDQPIGCINQADPSLPMNGSMYVVKRDEDGSLVDYDKNDEEYIAEESPEWAYFATDWSIARVVYSVPLPFWKSPALWVTILIWVVIFIWGLVLIGGE
jgi:hypothetical protein